MLALLVLLLASPDVMGLKRNAMRVTQSEAAAMAPAALADAVLQPGHPTIVYRVMLPDGWTPVPPPPFVPPLDVQLIAASTLDAASGFCVKRNWHLRGSATGEVQTLTVEPSYYRLPSRDGDCEASPKTFFRVAASDRPRAFTIVRLLAAAVADPRHFPGVVSVGDAGSVPPTYRVLGRAEGRATLATLPIDRVFSASRYIGAPLLGPGDLAGVGGGQRENWELFVSDPHGGMVWSVHLALDQDRIAIVRMIHAIPAPF